MTYRLCAEDITKKFIVPSLPDEEKDDLLVRGFFRMSRPQETGIVSCVQ